MASTLTKILLHITFSTKNRADLIPPETEQDLYAYMGGICRNMESALHAAGGIPDHLHLMVTLGKTVCLSDLMLNVKRDSSKWLKEHGAAGFGWQDGYFAFSIGESGTDDLRRYIENQKTHHRRIDFKDEMRALLKKYRIDADERYMWD